MSKIVLTMLLLSAQVMSGEFAPLRIQENEFSWSGEKDEVQFTAIAGEEATAGMYVFRVKFPAGYQNQPHYHTDERVVTVMSGELWVGYGEHFDAKSMIALGAGSVFTEPKNQPHYVWAKSTEVIIQVVGSGPSRRVLVKP